MIYATSGFELAARKCLETTTSGRGRTDVMFDPREIGRTLGSLAISSPPTAFGRCSVLLYFNVRSALRESAASLAHVDGPKT
jgi:hypothetical protein